MNACKYVHELAMGSNQLVPAFSHIDYYAGTRDER